MRLKGLVKFFSGPSPHLSREDAMKVFRRDHFRCHYCGLDGLRNFESWLILTIDHIHPHAKGGQRRMDNLVTFRLMSISPDAAPGNPFFSLKPFQDSCQ